MTGKNKKTRKVATIAFNEEEIEKIKALAVYREATGATIRRLAIERADQLLKEKEKMEE